MGFNVTWTQYDQPNITGFYEGMKYANSVTENWFSPFILISLWIIMFMTMRRWGETKSFAASSFITFIISGILRAMSLVSDMWVLIFLLFSGVSLIFLFRE
jgi:hypothetical protein